MPQVYLPSSTTALSAGGNIIGQDVTLDFKGNGQGSVLNTGNISASGTLKVDTPTLTNEANQVDVGQIWSKVKGGYIDTTGTEVQPGGFMSAANMDLNVQTLNQIGGALQKLNADGTVDQAGTQQLLASLSQQLGTNFTQQTLTDHLHTDFVKGGGGLPMVVVAALAIVASIVTAGAAAAALGVVMTQLSIGTVLIGALGGMVGSAVSQIASGQGLNLGQIMEAGAIGALSAGLMAGLHVAGTAALQGLGKSIANGTVTLSQVGGALAQIGERGLIAASVNTAIEGGSFGKAFENSVVGDLGAVGASAIGAASNDPNSVLAEKSPGYVLAHAGLGCALSAAEGNGCAGGAIGGAATALVAPLIRDALYSGSQTVTYSAAGGGQILQTTSYDNSVFNALTVGTSMAISGAVAGMVGVNDRGAEGAAANAVFNNELSPKYKYLDAQRVSCSGQPIGCYQALLMATEQAYVRASKDVEVNCHTGGDAGICQTAISDKQQLYVKGRALLQTTSSYVNGKSGMELATGIGLGGAFGALFSRGSSISSGVSGESGDRLIVGDEPYAGPDGTSDGGMTHPVGTNGTATNTARTSAGTANAATQQGLKDQLANENLANIAAQDPRLAAAMKGSGTSNINFSIGSGTTAEANQLGKIWVGDGATMMSDGSGLLSADGTRAYRFPSEKVSPYATTGTQANFEAYNVNPVTGQRVKVSNGHLNVAD